MSWPVIIVLSLLYWILLFVRLRMRGRQALDRAFDQAAAANAGRESFEVTVPIETRPLHSAVVVLAVPVLLVLSRMFFARGVH